MRARGGHDATMQPAAGRRLRVKDLCVVLVFAGAVVTTLTSGPRRRASSCATRI